jgi:hypothetical protein
MSVILLIFLLFGCAMPHVPVLLYGVSGPYEGKVVEGKAHVTGGNSGRIEITLPNGEYCTGDYSIITQGLACSMSAQWQGLYQSVYGTGYTSTVLRTCQGMGTALGNNGTVLEVNFLPDSLSGHGFGVAKDNKGNIYRVQF